MGTVLPACNTTDLEAGRLLRIWGYIGLHSKILSQKQQQQQKLHKNLYL